MCRCAGQGGQKDGRAVTPPLGPLNLPSMASNNYFIKCISTCATGDGFNSFCRCVHLAFSQAATFPPHICVRTHKDWECVPRLASHTTAMVPGVVEGPRLAAGPRARLHLQPRNTRARAHIPSGSGQPRAGTPRPKQLVQSVFQGMKTVSWFLATDFQQKKDFLEN